jgi:hypothetical protein
MAFSDKICTHAFYYPLYGQPCKALQLAFYKFNAEEILILGEFEAFRRWIIGGSSEFPSGCDPKESHALAREFFKELRAEQKRAQEERRKAFENAVKPMKM